jgi:hypothetical protein
MGISRFALRRSRRRHTFDPLGMVLDERVVLARGVSDDLGEVVLENVRAALLRVFRLHDNHVASVAAALLQQAAGCGALFKGGDDLKDIAAEADW